MSLQVLYSFDHIATANIGFLPEVISTGPGCSIAEFSGRGGTGCLVTTDALNASSGVNYGFNVAITPHQDVTVGTWVTIESIPAAHGILMAFGNPGIGPPAVSDKALALVVAPDGSLRVWAGEPGTPISALLATSPSGVVTFGLISSHYIEFRGVIGPDASTGLLLVYVDGVAVIGLAVNTHLLGVSQVTHIMLGNPVGSNQTRFDDIYIQNGADTGDGWFSVRGAIQVEGKIVEGPAGEVVQWTPSSPTGLNHTNVNEATADITTFNSATAIGVKDLYNVQNITYVPSAIQVDFLMRKVGGGASSVSPVVRPIPGGPDFIAPAIPLPTTYKYRRQIYTSNPAGVAWTTASFNANQIGVLKAE